MLVVPVVVLHKPVVVLQNCIFALPLRTGVWSTTMERDEREPDPPTSGLRRGDSRWASKAGRVYAPA